MPKYLIKVEAMQLVKSNISEVVNFLNHPNLCTINSDNNFGTFYITSRATGGKIQISFGDYVVRDNNDDIHVFSKSAFESSITEE